MGTQTQIKSAKPSTPLPQTQVMQNLIWEAQDAVTLANNAASKAQGYHKLISEKIADVELRADSEVFARQGTDRRLHAIAGEVANLSQGIWIKSAIAGFVGALVFQVVVMPFMSGPATVAPQTIQRGAK
jgi:3-hydroxy-3-methylglutaryl CoA synthase